MVYGSLGDPSGACSWQRGCGNKGGLLVRAWMVAEKQSNKTWSRKWSLCPQPTALLALHFFFFPLLPSQHLQPHFSECRQKSLPSSCLQDGSSPVPLPQHPPLSQPICPHATSSQLPPGKASPSAFPPSLLQGTLAAELCVPSTSVLPLPAAGSWSHPSHNQATARRSVHSLPSIAWSERKTHSISILSPVLLPLFLPLPEATCEQMQTPRKGSDLLK